MVLVCESVVIDVKTLILIFTVADKLLQLPHELPDEKRLDAVCAKLNQLEMKAIGLPPHFGAWCAGKRGNNPAYVCFIPNALYSVSGIALNAAVWAMNRARLANTMLAEMGVRA